MTTAVSRAVERAVLRLCRVQHPRGSWSDFHLAPGPSDGWVTAYTGVALAEAARDGRLNSAVRRRAGSAADAACEWLAATVSADGGWGWSSAVRPDADSTAWAVRLLALRGSPLLKGGLEFLAQHDDSGGYRTYRSARISGSWASSSADVSAAVLLARLAAGDLNRAGLAREWRRCVEVARDADGWWRSQWWDGPGYPSAIAGAAWAAAGRPWTPVRPRPVTAGRGSAWQAACRLWSAASFAATPGGQEDAARSLLLLQRPHGGWVGDATLLVPPPRPGGRPAASTDARGIFTTATALHALLAHRSRAALPIRPVRRVPPRASTPLRYAAAVEAMSVAAGVDPASAVRSYAALTAECLRENIWPARQLSTLAGGSPLEFSVGASPGLRLTTDAGDPTLAPRERLASGLRAFRRTARLLGLDESLAASSAAVAVLADGSLPVPEGCRFWLWAGLDLCADKPPVLKAYVSLHAEHVAGWQQRERAFLDACGVPAEGVVHSVLDRLKQDGWCHEAGVGLGADGRWGVKVYYELRGYRRETVREVLAMSGLDPDPTALSPEVPGVLRESLAAKQRAGIALRVDPGSGTVTEVTIAAAFPTPAVGRPELADRIQRSLTATGQAHAAAVATLLPGWQQAPESARMHSLLTRSRSRLGDETKIYLRPWLPATAAGRPSRVYAGQITPADLS